MQIQTPFYTFLPADKTIKQLNKKGLVDLEGRATPNLKQKCCQYPFKIDDLSRQEILKILQESFQVKTRIPLHIKISMDEIILEIRKIANTQLKVLFIGGALWKALKPLFLDFLNECGL